MFEIRFPRFWKYLNTTWNLPEQPFELTQKQARERKTAHWWYSCVITVTNHCHGIISEGL